VAYLESLTHPVESGHASGVGRGSPGRFRLRRSRSLDLNSWRFRRLVEQLRLAVDWSSCAGRGRATERGWWKHIWAVSPVQSSIASIVTSKCPWSTVPTSGGDRGRIPLRGAPHRR